MEIVEEIVQELVTREVVEERVEKREEPQVRMQYAYEGQGMQVAKGEVRRLNAFILDTVNTVNFISY